MLISKKVSDAITELINREEELKSNGFSLDLDKALLKIKIDEDTWLEVPLRREFGFGIEIR